MQNQITITRDGLARSISRNVGIKVGDAYDYIDVMLSIIADNIAKGNTVTLPNIGNLVIRHKASRMGRNPKTKEPKEIKARTVVRLKITPKLRASVNSNINDLIARDKFKQIANSEYGIDELAKVA